MLAVSAIPLIGASLILGSFVLGLIPSGSAGNTFILMTMMAIALIPTPRRRLLISLVDSVAALLVGVAWLTAFNRPIVVEWMNAVGGNDLVTIFGQFVPLFG